MCMSVEIILFTCKACVYMLSHHSFHFIILTFNILTFVTVHSSSQASKMVMYILRKMQKWFVVLCMQRGKKVIV